MVDPAGAPLLEPELYELDGIPLAHLPMAGPTILTLAFGVGRAHEPPLQSGVTHLLEHLLLTKVAGKLDVGLDHSNGTTEPFRVTFTMRGDPGTVSRFLAEICRAIEQPPIARMHGEAVVLRTETADRGGSGIPQSIFLRTGFQGVGKLRLPELVLERLDEAELRAWLAQHFTAGNAAIWIAGTLPDELLVSLPEGGRTPVPPYLEIDGLRTPTIFGSDASGFAMSFTGRRGAATMTALRVLDGWLTRAMRVDNALGYSVGSQYVRVGPDAMVGTAWASCLPEKIREVGRAFLEVVDDLAARGPTDEELNDRYRGVVGDLSNPAAIPAVLDAHVCDVLMGVRPQTTAELVEEQWRLQPAEVLDAFRRLRDSLLLVVPWGAERPQRHFEPYPGPVIAASASSRTYPVNEKSSRNPFRKSAVPTLAVGDRGVAVRDRAGRLLSGLTWADAVAVVRRGDGARVLFARDGYSLAIEPDDWKDGRGAIALIDRHAPREVVVRLGG